MGALSRFLGEARSVEEPIHSEGCLRAVKKTVTIKNNHEFRRLYSKGRSAVTPYLVVYCRRNRLGHNRLGVTVSTKLGCAVVRNRARRRIRELYRLAQPGMKQGYDLVVVARSRAHDAPYRKLSAAYDKALAQLGLLAGEGEQ